MIYSCTLRFEKLSRRPWFQKSEDDATHKNLVFQPGIFMYVRNSIYVCWTTSTASNALALHALHFITTSSMYSIRANTHIFSFQNAEDHLGLGNSLKQRTICTEHNYSLLHSSILCFSEFPYARNSHFSFSYYSFSFYLLFVAAVITAALVAVAAAPVLSIALKRMKMIRWPGAIARLRKAARISWN